MKPKQITNAMRKQAVELVNRHDKHPLDVAAKFGVSIASVYRWMRLRAEAAEGVDPFPEEKPRARRIGRRGPIVPRRAERYRLGDDFENFQRRVVDFYVKGGTLRSTARTFSVSAADVRKWAEAAGHEVVDLVYTTQSHVDFLNSPAGVRTRAIVVGLYGKPYYRTVGSIARDKRVKLKSRAVAQVLEQAGLLETKDRKRWGFAA